MTTICLKIVEQLNKVSTKLIATLADAQYAAEKIVRDEAEHIIINEEILLVYCVGSPWYSKKLVVNEMMVLRLYPGKTDMSAVTDTLDYIKSLTKADVSVVGGAFSDKPQVLARAYRKLGYTLDDSPELYRR